MCILAFLFPLPGLTLGSSSSLSLGAFEVTTSDLLHSLSSYREHSPSLILQNQPSSLSQAGKAGKTPEVSGSIFPCLGPFPGKIQRICGIKTQRRHERECAEVKVLALHVAKPGSIVSNIWSPEHHQMCSGGPEQLQGDPVDPSTTGPSSITASGLSTELLISVVENLQEGPPGLMSTTLEPLIPPP